MKVVILCGGKGTRMRDMTEFIPKPLVPIGGKPVIWHIMKLYSSFGFKEFILCLGYKGSMIKEYFRHSDWMNNDFTIDRTSKEMKLTTHGNDLEDWKITFVDTGQDTMTGGRIKRIEKFIGEGEFMVTYGDGLADVDVRKLLEVHRKMGRIATLTAVHPMSQFGVLEHENGLVKTFKEKPRLDGIINGGFFVFNRKIFSYLIDDSTILEEEPLKRLTRDGQLAMYEHTDFWKCMDTPKDAEELNKLWDSGNASWKVWK